MRKPDNYDETAAQTGGFEQLPAGAYNCIIKDANEIQSKSGKAMLQLRLDIADGKHKDYFQNLYTTQNRKYADVKWKGIYNQLTEGESLGFFKGLIQDIEDSNPGYKFNFDEKTLKDKKIGGVFGREQFKAQDGTLKFTPKCFYCVDIKRVKDIDAPADKLIEQSNFNSSYNNAATNSPMTEIDTDSELPF